MGAPTCTGNAGGVVDVRRATTGDAASIAAVHVRSWQTAYQGIVVPDYLNSLSIEHHTGLWYERLNADHSDVSTWVATRENQVVGFLAAGPARDDDLPGAGEIYAIYVDPSAWGTGAGSALFRFANEWLVASGHQLLALWVLRDNAVARRFYEARGWAPDGTEAPVTIGGFEVVEVRYVRAVV